MHNLPTPLSVLGTQKVLRDKERVTLALAASVKGSCGNCKCARPPLDNNRLPLSLTKRRYCTSKEGYVQTYNVCGNWQGAF